MSKHTLHFTRKGQAFLVCLILSHFFSRMNLTIMSWLSECILCFSFLSFSMLYCVFLLPFYLPVSLYFSAVSNSTPLNLFFRAFVVTHPLAYLSTFLFASCFILQIDYLEIYLDLGNRYKLCYNKKIS